MTVNYQHYVESYRQWLETLGYSKSTVYYSPRQLSEFLQWLEQKGISELQQINPEIIQAFFKELQQRKNRRKAGTISNNYINKHVTVLKSFSRCLRELYEITLPLESDYLPLHQKPISLLTKSEIKQLFEVTENTALGLRDRAMLSIYYGCGLRRTEGVQLNVLDINTKDNVLLVRKAKNGKQRLVPFTDNTKTELFNYLHYGRPLLDKQREGHAFFLSRRGNRINGTTLFERLKSLAKNAGIEKNVGLHTLRHSIATHLLQSGMKLEYISRFLGHNSLESTQLYTHIVNEMGERNTGI